MPLNPETIKPLPFKEIDCPEWFDFDEERKGYWNARLRLIFFDPKEIYERIEPFIDINRRKQGKLNIEKLFPKNEYGICRCGCNQKTERQWATQNCKNFAYRVYAIIAYGTQQAKVLMQTYFGDKCCNCNENNWEDLDHDIPVKHGGGACWLSNFKPLCKQCHKDKTKKDFKWGEYKETAQVNLFIEK